MPNSASLRFVTVMLAAAQSILFTPVIVAAPMVELFTSQGCYSCPPADKHLGELIKSGDDIVALSFHVDYWDKLRYGSAGVWKDPFSDPAYTQRQRNYKALGLRGNNGVYTPQMVLNGTSAEVGHKRTKVRRGLSIKQPPLDLEATIAGENLALEISGSALKQEIAPIIWLAVFDIHQETQVPTGENHGKTMTNHHVVRKLIPLKRWDGSSGKISFNVSGHLDPANGNQSCAVFIQSANLGPIYGAEYCS